jgi:hypothetical protein
MNRLEQLVLEQVGVLTRDIFTSWNNNVSIAETEIERACKKAPIDKRALLFGSFRTLRARLSMPENAFRSHCRELLKIIEDGKDIQQVTKSELLTVMHGSSLLVPMNGDGLAVTAGLFRELYPDALPQGFWDRVPQADERFQGYRDKLLEDGRQVLAKRLPGRDEPRPLVPDGKRRERMARDGIVFVEVIDSEPVQLDLFASQESA